MEDPRWAQLTSEIAVKNAEMKELWALKRTAKDERTRADLTEQLQQLQADKQGLLDLKKTLAAAAAAQPQQGVCGSGWLYALCTFVLLYLGESSMHARCKMQ